MPDYKQIPTHVAEQCDKSQVIIAAWDPVHQLTHVTTYGVSAEDKVQAAQGGEVIAQVLGLDRSKERKFEDFRDALDAGLYREAIELLVLICRRQGCTGPMLQQAERITKAAGRGVRQG